MHDEPEAPSPSAPARTGISNDRLLGLSAVFLSLAALVVSVFQTAILRDQQRASVWPHLQVDTDKRNATYELKLTNSGVGPAIIRFVALEHAGRPYELFGALFNDRMRGAVSQQDSTAGYFWSDIAKGNVVQAGQEFFLLRTTTSRELQGVVDSIITDSTTHLRIRYADVYGEEWEWVDGRVVER